MVQCIERQLQADYQHRFSDAKIAVILAARNWLPSRCNGMPVKFLIIHHTIFQSEKRYG